MTLLDLAACAVHAVAAFVLTSALVSIERRKWLRTDGMHWTVRAVAAQRLRLYASHALFATPFLLVAADRLMFGTRVDGVLVRGLWGLAAAMCVSLRTSWSVYSNTTSAERGAQTVGVVLIIVRFAPIGAVAAGVGDSWMWAAALFPLVAALPFGLGPLVKPLLVRWRWLKPPDDRLAKVVRESAAASGVPVPETLLAVAIACTAYADIILRRLIFTERIVRELSEAQLAAVCTHELAHLSETRAAVAGRVAATLSLCVPVFVQPALASFGMPGLAGVLLLMVGMIYGGMVLSRSLERRADGMAKASESDPGVYASALERIYAANLIPAVLGGRGRTHPHLYDRMVAAGVTPDYPRPKPPGTPWLAQGLLITAIIALMITMARD
jgi:Zn-dependent protease with chaperone function